MDLLPTLRDAVVRRVPVSFRYADEPEPRVVQPHAVFRTRDGQLRLCGLQVGGRATVGALPAWFDFDLHRVSDLVHVPGRFRVAPDFDPGAQRFAHGVVALVLR